MKKIYFNYLLLSACGLFLSILIASCHKDPKVKPGPPAAQPFAKIGLYEIDSSIYRRIFIPVSQVGTVDSINYLVFDTGSSGMSIDAKGLLPASMITSSGITVAGDSVNVNGITVTSQSGYIAFGNTQSELREYGNLAYAIVKIGDSRGSVTTSRIPFFLYYKIQDVTSGGVLPPHSNDVFGVGPGVSFANTRIGSPLSYFSTANANGTTNGFKLATLNAADFTLNAIYVSDLLTIGLVPSDLNASSGFILHPLSFFSLTQGGYSPDIPATVSYNGTNVAATILFDTGTPAISIIANQTNPTNSSSLPPNTAVTITTNNGFTYQYTTTSDYNLTDVAKPSFTGDPRTIFGIDFFLSNEFLMDYTGHNIGLKNN